MRLGTYRPRHARMVISSVSSKLHSPVLLQLTTDMPELPGTNVQRQVVAWLSVEGGREGGTGGREREGGRRKMLIFFTLELCSIFSTKDAHWNFMKCNTVEPLNKGHTGTLGTVLYREVVLYSEVK